MSDESMLQEARTMRPEAAGGADTQWTTDVWPVRARRGRPVSVS